VALISIVFSVINFINSNKFVHSIPLHKYNKSSTLAESSHAVGVAAEAASWFSDSKSKWQTFS
jgi:hypothetical protein